MVRIKKKLSRNSQASEIKANTVVSIFNSAFMKKFINLKKILIRNFILHAFTNTELINLNYTTLVLSILFYIVYIHIHTVLTHFFARIGSITTAKMQKSPLKMLILPNTLYPLNYNACNCLF